MKQNRLLSFIIVTFIYILASILGIIIFKHLQFDLWLNLLIADIIATIFVFVFSVLLKNASVYDPYWSVQPIVIVIAFCFIIKPSLASILAIVAICLWGIRLTANWAYTFKNLEHQDWRYTMLKEKTKKFYPIINFIGIHMVPTLIVYGCTLPVIYLMIYGGKINVFTILFFILACGSFVLQGIADIQMHKFRLSKPTVFIRNGVWKYSRHPNYLGEIMMWWSIGLLVISSLEDRFYLLVGAILNTLLFLFVSIPMAEKHQKNRKPGFDEYKKQTRMLLPIVKK